MTSFTNNQTDRIYIATRDGALQCLHELGADLPTLHVSDRASSGRGESRGDRAQPQAACRYRAAEEPDTNPFKGETNPFGSSWPPAAYPSSASHAQITRPAASARPLGPG